MRFFVEASTQSVPLLRTGNNSAWLPRFSITQTSRSPSDGAIETGSHLSGGHWSFSIKSMNAHNGQTMLIYINARLNGLWDLLCSNIWVSSPHSPRPPASRCPAPGRRSWGFLISDLDAVPPALLGDELPIRVSLNLGGHSICVISAVTPANVRFWGWGEQTIALRNVLLMI